MSTSPDEAYTKLTESYKSIKMILFPTLTKKKQDVLEELITIIISQIDAYKELKNSEVSDMSSFVGDISNKLAKIINLVVEKNETTIISSQDNFFIKALRKHRIHPLNNEHTSATNDSVVSKIKQKMKIEKYPDTSRSMCTLSRSKEKKPLKVSVNRKREDLWKETKCSRMKKITKHQLSMSAKNVLDNSNNSSSQYFTNVPTEAKKISTLTKFYPPNKTLKNIEKQSASSKDLSKVSIEEGRKGLLRSKSALKDNFSNYHSNPPACSFTEQKNSMDYDSFAEKTFKDFEKLGTKPSNYAKYLVRKYKDVVEKFEKIDNEEEKKIERYCNNSGSKRTNKVQKGTPKDSIAEFINKNKKKLGAIGKFGFTWSSLPTSKKEENSTPKEGRIVVKKQS